MPNRRPCLLNGCTLALLHRYNSVYIFILNILQSVAFHLRFLPERAVGGSFGWPSNYVVLLTFLSYALTHVTFCSIRAKPFQSFG